MGKMLFSCLWSYIKDESEEGGPIRVAFSYDGKNVRAFLLVEGSTDEQIYQWLVAEDKCRIVITHSKENAIKAFFSQTQLYAAMQIWESNNGAFVVLMQNSQE
jgi:hypothetical protein